MLLLWDGLKAFALFFCDANMFCLDPEKAGPAIIILPLQRAGGLRDTSLVPRWRSWESDFCPSPTLLLKTWKSRFWIRIPEFSWPMSSLWTTVRFQRKISKLKLSYIAIDEAQVNLHVWQYKQTNKHTCLTYNVDVIGGSPWFWVGFSTLLCRALEVAQGHIPRHRGI